MKQKAIFIIAVLIALSVGASVLLTGCGDSPKKEDPAETAAPTVIETAEQEDWSTAYFSEMRGLYNKIGADALTEQETNYNALVDRFNAWLDKYETAVAAGLTPEQQSKYDAQINSLLQQLETAQKELAEQTGEERDTLLEQFYELEAEITEAMEADASIDFSSLLEKVTETKIGLDQSTVRVDEAKERYSEYSEEFEKEMAPDNKETAASE